MTNLTVTMADQLIQSWIETRNLDPLDVTDKEMNEMMWQLANARSIPPNRARAAVRDALRRYQANLSICHLFRRPPSDL